MQARLWWILLAIALAAAAAKESHAQVPAGAMRYQRDLVRNARAVWGIAAPIAAFAGQIHQESAWRTDARSAYASGLAQFTPATADWISSAYRSELGANQPLNPSWALRALVRYDRHLWEGQRHYDTPCDRYAFVLSAYNGGQGWVNRRQRLALEPGQYDTTSRINPGVSAASQRENQEYPRRILLRWQPLYAAWGPGIDCRGTMA